jgi:hypothetical protein
MSRAVLIIAALALAFSACTCSPSSEEDSALHRGGSAGVLVGGGAGGGLHSGGSGGVTGGTGGTISSNGGADAGPTGLLPCSTIPPASDPIPPEWPVGAKRLPALDADVNVFELPPDPSPLTWKDCGKGCMQLENTWAPSIEHGLFADSVGGLVKDKPWVMLTQRWSTTQFRQWIGPVSGTAALSLVRGNESGAQGFSSFQGVTSAGYAVAVFLHDSATWMMAAAPTSKLSCLFMTRSNTKNSAFFNKFVTTVDRWAASGDDYSPILTGKLPLDKPNDVLPTMIPKPTSNWANGVVALDNGFAFHGYHEPPQTSLWVWTGGGGTTRLVSAPPPSDSDYGVASDGTHVVWQHGSGLSVDSKDVARWSKVVLMTATNDGQFPLTGSPVGQLPTVFIWAPLLLRGDYVLGWTGDWNGGDNTPYLLRLSDRRIWLIPPRGKSVFWLNAVYLADDEVALLEKTRLTYVGWADTIVRYRFDALGPGQPLDDVVDGGTP